MLSELVEGQDGVREQGGSPLLSWAALASGTG
jgi:hypothetical protein